MSKSDSWSVTLTPHRSLSRQGFLVVMLVIGATSFISGLFFLAIGAWPILGFFGLDVLLIWWAFRANFADSRRAERIVAEGDVLRLLRRDPTGREQEVRFNRRWVRVELECDEARELVGRLFLRSHGVVHEVAAFLGAEERQSLARALRHSI